eukprot:501671-Rhodomonas_salina.1
MCQRVDRLIRSGAAGFAIRKSWITRARKRRHTRADTRFCSCSGEQIRGSEGSDASMLAFDAHLAHQNTRIAQFKIRASRATKRTHHRCTRAGTNLVAVFRLVPVPVHVVILVCMRVCMVCRRVCTHFTRVCTAPALPQPASLACRNHVPSSSSATCRSQHLSPHSHSQRPCPYSHCRQRQCARANPCLY